MILIIKAGTTHNNIKKEFGDFERWIIEKMNVEEGEFTIFDIGDYQSLPPKIIYDGIIITGSHSMVTDIKLQNCKICDWLLEKQKNKIPILGICYGHQLLSVINGGTVKYNNTKTKVGSKTTYLTDAGSKDKLLGEMPSMFKVYKFHKQSVVKLPKNAELLAADKLGLIDAFRINTNTWGVQFHPEFDERITKSYIKEEITNLNAEGFDTAQLSDNVVSVYFGTKLLKRFKEISNKTNKCFIEKG